jgi:hypothetical protein
MATPPDASQRETIATPDDETRVAASRAHDTRSPATQMPGGGPIHTENGKELPEIGGNLPPA